MQEPERTLVYGSGAVWRAPSNYLTIKGIRSRHQQTTNAIERLKSRFKTALREEGLDVTQQENYMALFPNISDLESYNLKILAVAFTYMNRFRGLNPEEFEQFSDEYVERIIPVGKEHRSYEYKLNLLRYIKKVQSIVKFED